ncbi:MAG TPA: amino acid permease [Alphaproteobacteria bacterium]|nr:amino acid permease [Alphaproteobacteria bacterium]
MSVQGATMSGHGGHKPRRLGIWMSTALVVGNMIGSGVFLLPASLAAYGGISILGWLMTAAGALLLAFVFARLGQTLPKIGGPYAYSREGFGDAIGFQVAWGYWIAIWAGNAAIVTAFVGYLGAFWPALAGNAALSIATGIAVIWLLTFVNILGVRPSGMVQLLTTIGKLLPLLAVAAFGVFFFDAGKFVPFNQTGGSDFSAVTATAALTLWAFIGIESATIPAEDVEDPTHTIPRSTIIGTIVATLVYVLGTVAVMSVIPSADLRVSTAPFADAATVMFGPLAGTLVAIGALVSTFGCLNGWILLQGQLPLAAARDGLFPQAFARLSANGTPVFGLVISSVLVTLLMVLSYTPRLIDVFNFTLLLATMTTLVPYVFTACAQMVMVAREPGRHGGPRPLLTVAIAFLAFLYAMWTLYGAGAEVVLWGTLLILAGLPVYAWLRWQSPARGKAGG